MAQSHTGVTVTELRQLPVPLSQDGAATISQGGPEQKLTSLLFIFSPFEKWSVSEGS